MERRRFDIELEKLQTREFGSDAEALICLSRFTMFASACGYRGRVIQLAVKDGKIVKWPYGKPKPTFLQERRVTEQISITKVPAEPTRMTSQKEVIESDQKITPGEKIANQWERVKKPEEKPLARKSVPKPKALKREEKKGKVKKRKSRSSSGYKR